MQWIEEWGRMRPYREHNFATWKEPSAIHIPNVALQLPL